VGLNTYCGYTALSIYWCFMWHLLALYNLYYYFVMLKQTNVYFRLCILTLSTDVTCGPGCSGGIATDYELDGPGIELYHILHTSYMVRWQILCLVGVAIV
jgi:hypothetical protein